MGYGRRKGGLNPPRNDSRRVDIMEHYDSIFTEMDFSSLDDMWLASTTPSPFPLPCPCRASSAVRGSWPRESLRGVWSTALSTLLYGI